MRATFSNASDRGTARARADGSRPQLALLGTLLLLGIGYALLVSAPVVFQRFSLSTGSGGFGSISNASWLPAAAASGFAVGGAAALLFVLARLVRDIEHQPYACLAPVLAVFTAFVLAGVRAELPLHGFGSEHFSALAMAVAVLGGALVQQGGFVPGLLGMLVTLAPAATLIGVIASGMKRFDEPAIVLLDPKLRLFTVLLTAASLILVATAILSRFIVARVRVRSRQPLAGELTPIGGPAAEAAMWRKLRDQADPPTVGRPGPRISRQQIATAIDSIDIEELAWTSGFPRARRQHGMPGWLVAVLTLITLGAVGAVGHRAWLWNQHREAQLAMELRANEERQAREFAEAREARAHEAAAAQAQLAATAPAPQDPSSPTPVLAAAAALAPGAVPAPAAAMPTLEEQKHKAELEAQADRDAQAAREAEAKAAREGEAAAKAAAAAQARAEREAKAAELAEQKRLADEAREARHAVREQRKREHEAAERAAERKRELAARYAAQKKAKEDQKERAARDKAVGGMLDSNKDPIFGL
jgi:hypothetical protein